MVLNSSREDLFALRYFFLEIEKEILIINKVEFIVERMLFAEIKLPNI